MKVLEIKNNLVKVSYDIEDKLVLAGFTVIEDDKTPYVGQIVSLKADNGESYAIVKLLFTFDSEGIVNNYDGSIPKLDAKVDLLTCTELLDILPVQNPLKMGKIAQQDFLLNVDRSMISDNLLICSDNAKNTVTFVSNIVKQCENDAESSIIFDIDGKYDDFKKIIFGKHFKLPLNFETINFIYGNDLNDIAPTSKAIIQDIFLEVQEYTRTIPDKFIPFETFIKVVDQQYAESGIPELALLKNKLLKYKEENVFAESKYEINSLKDYIKDNYTVILDISGVEPKLQREIILYTYQVLEDINQEIYSFVKVNDRNSDKKLLKQILQEDKIYTTVICNHNYKYVYELKEKAENLILFAPETTQHDFASYNTFLNKLNHDEFIVCGSATQRIPLITELTPLEIVKPEPEPEILQEPASAEDLSDEPDNDAENIDDEDTNYTAGTEEQEDTPDFTENEDTYTDLSDDVDRTKPEEEDDFSALTEEEPEVQDFEEDFDTESENMVDRNISEEPELQIEDEASTNDFFTETEPREKDGVEGTKTDSLQEQGYDEQPLAEEQPVTAEDVLPAEEEAVIMPDGDIIEDDEISIEEPAAQAEEITSEEDNSIEFLNENDDLSNNEEAEIIQEEEEEEKGKKGEKRRGGRKEKKKRKFTIHSRF